MRMVSFGNGIVEVLISFVYNKMVVEEVSFLAVDISWVALRPTFATMEIVWQSYWATVDGPMILIDETFDVVTMAVYYFDMLAAISKT